MKAPLIQQAGLTVKKSLHPTANLFAHASSLLRARRDRFALVCTVLRVPWYAAMLLMSGLPDTERQAATNRTTQHWCIDRPGYIFLHPLPLGEGRGEGHGGTALPPSPPRG